MTTSLDSVLNLGPQIDTALGYYWSIPHLGALTHELVLIMSTLTPATPPGEDPQAVLEVWYYLKLMLSVPGFSYDGYWNATDPNTGAPIPPMATFGRSYLLGRERLTFTPIPT